MKVIWRKCWDPLLQDTYGRVLFPWEEWEKSGGGGEKWERDVPLFAHVIDIDYNVEAAAAAAATAASLSLSLSIIMRKISRKAASIVYAVPAKCRCRQGVIFSLTYSWDLLLTSRHTRPDQYAVRRNFDAGQTRHDTLREVRVMWRGGLRGESAW